MKKFATLATGALVASAIVPVFAVTDGSDSDVTVSETAILIAGGDFDFGTALPGALVDAETTYKVTTNSANGYIVNLEFTDLDRVAGPRSSSGTADVIQNELIFVDAAGNSAVAAAAESVQGGDPAADLYVEAAVYENAGNLATARKIADSAIRSLAAGDDFVVEVEMTLPWVSDGAYDGAATFTANNL
jgi:hypothetical protein